VPTASIAAFDFEIFGSAKTGKGPFDQQRTARAHSCPSVARAWAVISGGFVRLVPMMNTRAFCAAFALALIASCGGRQILDLPATTGVAAGASGGIGTTGNAGASGDAGETGVAGAAGSPAPTVGFVDLTQAPPTFSMTCDSGVGVITFVNPCLVGYVLDGDRDPTAPGPHEVGCTVATPIGNVGWSFEVLFPPLQNPQTILPLISTASGVDLGNGQQARISMVMGGLTFSHVDPTNRAFVARFIGVVTWTEPSGATFQCQVDTPVWGAPGPFA